ncbi:hypothetical protein ACK32X_13195 [Aeromonas dhakensis]|uniref:hypothetical protein n=1 Tax=Aeromonas dhakensis TaxID=196024 RepID=UPI00398713C4
MSWLGKPELAPTRHIVTAHQQTAEEGVGLSWLGKPELAPTRHIITAHQQTAKAGVGLRHTVAAPRQGGVVVKQKSAGAKM